MRATYLFWLVMIAVTVAGCGNTLRGITMRDFDSSLNQAGAERMLTEYLQKTINELPSHVRFVNKYEFDTGLVDACGAAKRDSPQKVAASLEVEPGDGMVEAIEAAWRKFGWQTSSYDKPYFTYMARTPDHYTMEVYRHGDGRVSILSASPCYPPDPNHPRAQMARSFTPRPR